MADRVIRDELLTSERYWSVSLESQRLYVHLVLVVDDTARFSGKNYTIRASCFPGQGVDPASIERMLQELHDADLIRLYHVAGERYVFVPRFKQKLRYFKSRFPQPPKEIDDTNPNAIPDVTPVQWQSIRQEVLERDGHQCLRCGATKRLSVDHITPRSLGGKSVVDNLITLCSPCNSWKRTNPDRSLEIIELIAKKQYLSNAQAVLEQYSSPLKRSEEKLKDLPPNPQRQALGASADKSASNPDPPPRSRRASGTNPRARGSNPRGSTAWRRSEAATLAKQRELGLIDYPGESWDSLRARIDLALAARAKAEAKAKAKVNDG